MIVAPTERPSCGRQTREARLDADSIATWALSDEHVARDLLSAWKRRIPLLQTILLSDRSECERKRQRERGS